jgi:hypothetical protein
MPAGQGAAAVQNRQQEQLWEAANADSEHRLEEGVSQGPIDLRVLIKLPQ